MYYGKNEHYSLSATLQSYMYKVYGWMSAALTITAVASYYVYSQTAILQYLLSNRFLMYGLLFAQIGLVIAITGLINRISFGAAFGLFILYATMVGVTLSPIFVVYQLGSIYAIFAMTAGIFGVMALYGYFTKSDLTSVGSLLTMVLFGIIIASIVNMFLASSMMQTIISFIAVLVFAGLTAYDAQKIKEMGKEMIAHNEPINKIALVGALVLYLDFINLFIHLLSLFGKRRD